MKKLLVFFYIDALNSSLLNPDIMPFLSRFSKQHYYQVLENVFGYSFAIQSCMLSGKYPDETNHWMPYFYSPDNSPMSHKIIKKIGIILPIYHYMPVIYNLIMILIRKIFKIKGVALNYLSPDIIDLISIYPYYYMCEMPVFFDLQRSLKEKLINLTYIGPPNNKKNYYDELNDHLKKGNNGNELLIIYDDKLDGIGHKYGPSSKEYMDRARYIDKKLSQSYMGIKKIYGDDFVYIIFSDHGQCDLLNKINIISKLNQNNLKLGKDYICIIDATIALFWPKNNEAKKIILKILNDIKEGMLIDKKLKQKYHLCFNTPIYGEIIFVLNPGATFFPNHYSSLGALKGLHGYSPNHNVQNAFIVSNEMNVNNIKHITDIKALILSII